MARTHIEVVDQDLEPYGQEQETLADVRRLINEQFRTLQGRLSDTDLIQCTLRATGRLIRILPNGKQEILIDSKSGVLVVPTGITFGPDGALYISNIGYGAPPVGAGQILKVELTD